jgi:hypothetical protein
MLLIYTELRFYSCCYTLVLIGPTRTLGFGARRPKQSMANFESVSLRYSILCSTINKGVTPAAQSMTLLYVQLYRIVYYY